MITPTIGRVVWVFRPGVSTDLKQAEPALICYVWNDRCVNVGGHDHNGQPFAMTSVPLLQDDDPVPSHAHAQWMPYQKEQAAK